MSPVWTSHWHHCSERRTPAPPPISLSPCPGFRGRGTLCSFLAMPCPWCDTVSYLWPRCWFPEREHSLDPSFPRDTLSRKATFWSFCYGERQTTHFYSSHTSYSLGMVTKLVTLSLTPCKRVSVPCPWSPKSFPSRSCRSSETYT